MPRWVFGVLLGLLIGSTAYGAYGELSSTRLEDVRVAAANNAPFEIPREYGRLAGVAVRGEIHHLYFEGADGSIRVVLIGPRGSIQRARNELQLLTPDVFLIPRGSAR